MLVPFLDLGPWSRHVWLVSLPAHSAHLVCSFQPFRLNQRTTPCEEFRAGWVLTVIGLPTNFWDLRRRSLCFFVSHSTKKAPFLSRLIDLSLPGIKDWKPFSIANGDSLVIGSASPPDAIKRKRGQFIVRVRISWSESIFVTARRVFVVVVSFVLGVHSKVFISLSFPLPTLHLAKQGDVNFSRDIRWSDIRAMGKIYSGIKNKNKKKTQPDCPGETPPLREVPPIDWSGRAFLISRLAEVWAKVMCWHWGAAAQQ